MPPQTNEEKPVHDHIARLDAMEQKIDAILESTEKARRYAMFTAIVTIAVIVLPALGLLIAIPQFLSTYNDIGSGSYEGSYSENLSEQLKLLEGL